MPSVLKFFILLLFIFVLVSCALLKHLPSNQPLADRTQIVGGAQTANLTTQQDTNFKAMHSANQNSQGNIINDRVSVPVVALLAVIMAAFSLLTMLLNFWVNRKWGSKRSEDLEKKFKEINY